MASPSNGSVEGINEEAKYDLSSILRSADMDYLIRNNGDQVKIDNLKGKTVGLYFSASWCGPCQGFTPNLVEAYNELKQVDKFEVIFISADQDDESFNSYFSKMPWLAVPFSDTKTREKLDKTFSDDGIPHLVFLDYSGKLPRKAYE
ncbi:Probable nucleoredoxin 1 [Striga hermonthica]|uniref:protein-disulfide reductase n=1 Tax=Striga hermonthica TaxID=68872 RepID=A0A9N7MS35_STRHE|nr:Probable nucleoredoxin 1 [Striga hermonthica]